MNSASRFLFGLLLFFGLIGFQVARAQNAVLIGPVSVSEITENDHVFEVYINRYQPDPEAVNYLSTYTDSVEIWVFFGSWCRESRKYLPGLVKTLRQADNDKIAVRYIGVDVEKKFPAAFLNMHQIKYIPSVVVLKGNAEIGRIVEKPRKLIETDLVEILKKAAAKK